jgi:hypothetical protein
MPSYITLRQLIHRMRALPRPHRGGIRDDAATLALRYAGPDMPPATVNIAALALSMSRLCVHELSRGVVQLIHDADLRSLPDKPPRMMQSAWLIDTRDPTNEPLGWPTVGGCQTVAVGGYMVDGVYYLVGLGYPDGAVVATWRPQWGEGEISIPIDNSPLVDDIEGYVAWGREAARFSLILGLVLEAEGAPITIRGGDGDKASERRSHRLRRPTVGDDWSIRRIILTRLEKRRGGAADDEAQSGIDGTAGRIPQQAMVRGHLRRQPYGPRNQLRKWVWVNSYEARRWVAPNVIYRIGT